ncbi:uncharacterized protein BO87DRAFT_27924 [Aspergillus neoniger CBS 115656]|uniref:Uncharacterized protein n=1 Tax=Aspergillus neoniger (strain CBS 115656) TaxID=1448310 RepID=A0A318YRK3_ASPNB|nr:hypothetical protein BO87DRAFT_27924 [Aspergillus neoniger CBS 115656]PYH35383.1 hypothetical protein BO87DRAFT_27924 [Aspergillus neoniger CBS 115656]
MFARFRDQVWGIWAYSRRSSPGSAPSGAPLRPCWPRQANRTRRGHGLGLAFLLPPTKPIVTLADVFVTAISSAVHQVCLPPFIHPPSQYRSQPVKGVSMLVRGLGDAILIAIPHFLLTACICERQGWR